MTGSPTKNPAATAIDLTACLAAASEGPLLVGQLVPLSNIGNLRVTYNWLYSALNCDPGDHSPFLWFLSSLGGQNVSLSPRHGYAGKTLYASVRDDYDYTVQVQAPFSADWITAAGRDETLVLSQQGLLTFSLTGQNGKYLCADGSPTTHETHAGYLFHSSATAIGPNSQFFLVVNALIQDVGIPLTSALAAEDIETALADHGAAEPAALAARIKALA